jgi:repressor of nif and glnA expression
MNYLITTQDELIEIRRLLNSVRSDIEYDVINSEYSMQFEELEVLLNEAVQKVDEIHDLLAEKVYAYDVTVTLTRRVYVKARNEEDAENAACDYALEDLNPSFAWNEDDMQAFRDEGEEDTTIFDVEV